jgi:phosphohistidine phosphatase
MQDDGEEEAAEQGERSIVLLRHGIAEDAGPGQRDEERALTSEGHARMKQIGKGLERAFPRAHTIYASPLLRAQQTAMWVSKAYRLRAKVETTEVLVPGAAPRELAEFLQSHRQGRLILVGHEPNLSTNLLALIRAADHAAVDFKKGGAACVRLSTAGTGVLQWMLTPRLLAKLAEE